MLYLLHILVLTFFDSNGRQYFDLTYSRVLMRVTSWTRQSPLGTMTTVFPIVPAPDARWWWLRSNWWNANWQGKPNYSKTCPTATSSTTNPTWPDPCSNPGRRSGKPTTNCLSYGTAIAASWTKYFGININIYSVVLSPLANYTDRAITAGQRS
jgi:hypothetical protein